MGARQFSPLYGQFLQPDGFDGALADQGLSLGALTMNRYALAGANPISFAESDGHDPHAVDTHANKGCFTCGGSKAGAQVTQDQGTAGAGEPGAPLTDASSSGGYPSRVEAAENQAGADAAAPQVPQPELSARRLPERSGLRQFVGDVAGWVNENTIDLKVNPECLTAETFPNNSGCQIASVDTVGLAATTGGGVAIRSGIGLVRAAAPQAAGLLARIGVKRATPTVEEGIYIIRGARGTYVGQSGQISTRLRQHARSGRFTDNEMPPGYSRP